MAGEKTEKATPKRKKDERKKGNIFMSRELVTVATLLAAFYTLKALSSFIFEKIEQLLTSIAELSAQTSALDVKTIHTIFTDCMLVFAICSLPMLLATSLAALISTMLQTKMLFATESFKFKGERLNPLSGFKKMFSLRALIELLKASIKISVLAVVLYNILEGRLNELPRLMDMPPRRVFGLTGEIISEIVLMVGILFIALGAADYLYQWWEYEKNLRMTKQEVKDEYKQMEGDPQIKGRIRSLQQQRARNRMMQAVPTADVVIRNPTHFAVALRYDREHDNAPVVVAKGKDRIAFKIIEVAQQNGVHVMEDRPLARALYASIEIGQEIPSQFYEPVAQALAFVYNLKKKESIS